MYAIRVVQRVDGKIAKQSPFTMPTKAEARRQGKKLRSKVPIEYRIEILRMTIDIIEEVTQ